MARHGTASWIGWSGAAALWPYTQKLSQPRKDSRQDNRDRPALWDISSGCVLWLPAKDLISPDALAQSQRLLDGNPKMFDHPVLVWDVEVSGPEDAVVTFMFMRSFKNHPEAKLSKLRPQYLRIAHFSTDLCISGFSARDDSSGRGAAKLFPSSQDPVTIEKSEGPIQEMDAGDLPRPSMSQNTDQTLLLFLETMTENRSMTENSFVDTRRLYAIEWQELRCYAMGQKNDGYRYRLNQASFYKVAEKVSRCTDSSQAPEWVKTKMLWETFVQRHIEGNVASHTSHSVPSNPKEIKWGQ